MQTIDTSRGSPGDRGRSSARYWFVLWLSGLLLPCVVIFALALLDWLGVFIPCESRWPFVSLFAVALTLMIAGIVSSEFSVPTKLALAILSVCLLPCCAGAFVVLMMIVFGFSAT